MLPIGPAELTGVPTGSDSGSGIPKLLEGAKLAFILALRQAFSSSLANESLRYNADPEQTKIKIYAAHPLTMEFFPSLIVSATSGDASIRYMADDYIEEDVPAGKIYYAGQLSFNISITALTNSTLDRERIIDHLIFFVRHLFRDVIHGFNIEYTKDIRIGSENVSEVENKPVYEQTMAIPVYMEYHSTVDINQLDTIRAIDIADVQVISATDIEQK